MKRAIVAAALTIAGALAAAPEAHAQQYLLGASAGLASGVEGGGRGYAEGFYRARTRLRLGVDARVDERPEEVFLLAMLAEIEPHTAIGADLRYGRALGNHWLLDAGVIGFFAPSTLLGAAAGIDYRVPLGQKIAFVVGPEVDVFFLGADLPDGSALWQLLVQGGIRVDL